MSDNNTQSSPARNEAVRVLATELDDATIQFENPDEAKAAENSDSRAPKYQLLPTGVGANRVLMMGACTEVRQVNDDPVSVRAKVVDDTGAFYIYAGQYNPEEVAKLQNIKTPEHVMVVGKINAYNGDDGTTYVSIDPENIATVDKETRERFNAEALSQTLDRLDAFEAGEAAYGEEVADFYETDHEALRDELDAIIPDYASSEAPVSEQPTAAN